MTDRKAWLVLNWAPLVMAVLSAASAVAAMWMWRAA